MNQTTPRRDHRGIITADTLRAWDGTDSELARRLGVTRGAVWIARRKHKIPAPFDGTYMASPTLSKTVVNAIVREARRRGTTVAKVLMDLNVWADSAVGPEVEG